MEKANIQVVAAVVSRGNSLLICRRPFDKRYGGLWEFPGGKCMPGESLASALYRELQEELELEVFHVGSVEITIPDPNSRFLISFVPVRVMGEPVCREHVAVRWKQLSEIARLPLAPSDQRYVEYRLSKLWVG